MKINILDVNRKTSQFIDFSSKMNSCLTTDVNLMAFRLVSSHPNWNIQFASRHSHLNQTFFGTFRVAFQMIINIDHNNVRNLVLFQWKASERKKKWIITPRWRVCTMKNNQFRIITHLARELNSIWNKKFKQSIEIHKSNMPIILTAK